MPSSVGEAAMEDLKTKLPWYNSDITDGSRSRTSSPCCTSSGASSRMRLRSVRFSGPSPDGEMGATILLATAVLGMLYPLLCGQPLTILGSIIALRTLGNAIGVKLLPLYTCSVLFLSLYLFLAGCTARRRRSCPTLTFRIEAFL